MFGIIDYIFACLIITFLCLFILCYLIEFLYHRFRYKDSITIPKKKNIKEEIKKDLKTIKEIKNIEVKTLDLDFEEFSLQEKKSSFDDDFRDLYS